MWGVSGHCLCQLDYRSGTVYSLCSVHCSIHCTPQCTLLNIYSQLMHSARCTTYTLQCTLHQLYYSSHCIVMWPWIPNFPKVSSECFLLLYLLYYHSQTEVSTAQMLTETLYLEQSGSVTSRASCLIECRSLQKSLKRWPQLFQSQSFLGILTKLMIHKMNNKVGR